LILLRQTCAAKH